MGWTFVMESSGVFRRARIIAGGHVIEDIDDFNRLSLMLTSLKHEEEQLMISSEGFWAIWW